MFCAAFTTVIVRRQNFSLVEVKNFSYGQGEENFINLFMLHCKKKIYLMRSFGPLVLDTDLQGVLVEQICACA